MILTRGNKVLLRGGKLLTRDDGSCWRGVLTVGEDVSGIAVGYDRNYAFGEFGEISNKPVLTCDLKEIVAIFSEEGETLSVGLSDNSPFEGVIEVDGKVYEMDGSFFVPVSENPFPPVGETCLIRILS